MITSRVGHSVFVVGGTGLLGRVVATHLLVARDFSGMVSRALTTPEARNRAFVVHGPEGITIADALRICWSILRPGTRLITVPIGIMRVIDCLFVGGRLE